MATPPTRASARQRRRHLIAESLLDPGAPASEASPWVVDESTEDTPATAVPSSPEVMARIRALLEDEEAEETQDDGGDTLQAAAPADPTLDESAPASARTVAPRGPLPAPRARLVLEAPPPPDNFPAWLVWGPMLLALAALLWVAAG